MEQGLNSGRPGLLVWSNKPNREGATFFSFLFLFLLFLLVMGSLFTVFYSPALVVGHLALSRSIQSSLKGWVVLKMTNEVPWPGDSVGWSVIPHTKRLQVPPLVRAHI